MMAITYFRLRWYSEMVPEDVAGVDEILESSEVWEMVRYAGAANHSVTVLTVIKDFGGLVVGEFNISFSPCNRGFIESEVRSWIVSQVLQSLRGKTRRSKRVVGDRRAGQSLRTKKNMQRLMKADSKRKVTGAAGGDGRRIPKIVAS